MNKNKFFAAPLKKKIVSVRKPTFDLVKGRASKYMSWAKYEVLKMLVYTRLPGCTALHVTFLSDKRLLSSLENIMLHNFDWLYARIGQ